MEMKAKDPEGGVDAEQQDFDSFQHLYHPRRSSHGDYQPLELLYCHLMLGQELHIWKGPAGQDDVMMRVNQRIGELAMESFKYFWEDNRTGEEYPVKMRITEPVSHKVVVGWMGYWDLTEAVFTAEVI